MRKRSFVGLGVLAVGLGALPAWSEHSSAGQPAGRSSVLGTRLDAPARRMSVD